MFNKTNCVCVWGGGYDCIYIITYYILKNNQYMFYADINFATLYIVFAHTRFLTYFISP